MAGEFARSVVRARSTSTFTDPAVQIAVVGVVALLCVVAVAFAMDVFVGRGLRDDWHAFDPAQPEHCAACVAEAERRDSLRRFADENREFAKRAIERYRAERESAPRQPLELVRR